MSKRQNLIQGRTKLRIPDLRGAMVQVAKRASWTRLFILLGILVLVSSVAAGIVFQRNFSRPSVAQDIPSTDTLPVVYRHPLTGVLLESPLEESPQVFGVMVENAADARPLSGLDQAFLVIEAPVEGNIARTIAFFSEEANAEKIGPVRSSRPYYLDWAGEFEAVYAHVGGSPDALTDIRTHDTSRDLDEYFQSEYFWRDRVRYAPHNAYTSSALLKQALEEVGESDFAYGSWDFKDAIALVAESESISPVIDWAEGVLYDVTWKHDQVTNRYSRIQSSSPMKMTSGDAIFADNVVVIETDVSVIDSQGRKSLRTLGEGDAFVYQDGNKISANWKKDTRTERLRFYDESNNEIAFNPGVTWIEVVSTLEKVGE